VGLSVYRGPQVLLTAGECHSAVHILAATARPRALSLLSATVTPAAVRPLLNIAASSRRVKAPGARTHITQDPA
jgi:hypothetical protein